MTKVIKEEFEKNKDVKVEDVSLIYDTPLEIFNMEVSRLSRIDNDLFTYEVEVVNIPYNSKINDDSEDEADDDMGYDSSDVAFIEWLRSKFFNYKTMGQYTIKALWIYYIRGDDKVEPTDEESSDNEDQIAEVFRIDNNVFDYETPICSAFNEFNYLLKIDLDLLTKDIEGFKTYDDYKDDWIYEWNKNVPMMDTVMEETYLELTLLKINSIIRITNGTRLWMIVNLKIWLYETLISDDDNESCYEQRIRWNVYTNYDDAYEINHDGNEEEEELCEVHELPVCNIRKYRMIKYPFNNDEEYVAVKEDDYGDLTITRKDAYQAYQEIFQIMDEDLMKEISTNIGGEFSNLEDLEVLES
ncbi:hypothetical protein Tco_1405105 [Tanacetum coccineum]